VPKLIISNQTNPYLNIAVENYLLSQPSDGDIIMYLWQNRRTVVIGQNQNPYSECNVAQLEADGGFLMRRRTGGGAVFHDLGNLNFSFVVPYEMYDTTRQFAVLQRAVESYGLDTEISGRNDVLCQGRKFSGNAFAKGRQQRLHHGTILIRTDVEQLQRYLKVKPAKLQKHGVASVQSRVVNLSELVPEITAQNIIPNLIQAFEAEYGSPLQTIDFDTLATRSEVQELSAEFASPEWKYGRWQQFEAQRSAQFDWGEVEVDVQVDEAVGIIRSVAIASDSLFPEAIAQAERLLTAASIHEPPAIGHLPESEQQMLRDIFSLLYSTVL
jgi:lipoate-protein ligase A